MSSRLAHLKPATLREQARAALRASIITGEIGPGQLYSVGMFAERLGVSATPIREAVSDLVHKGLIIVVRNRGFAVPEISEHDLDEIFELRMLLEVPAVERVAGHLSPEDVAACREEVERGTRAARAGDLPGFLEADRAFHLRLLASLDNARLVDMVDNLRDQARLYGLADLATDGALVASAEEHQRLLATIDAKDPDAARHQMTLHLKHTRGAWAGRTEAWSEDAPRLR